MKFNHTCNLYPADDGKKILKTCDYLTDSESLLSPLCCENCGFHIAYPKALINEIDQ